MVFIHPHNQFKVASLSERLLLILFQLFRWRSNSLLTGFLFPIFLATPTPTLLMTYLYQLWGFPGGTVVKNLPANAGDARDLGSVSGLGRSPGVGNGNPLPGKFHGQRSLTGYSPWGCKESDTTEWLLFSERLGYHPIFTDKEMEARSGWLGQSCTAGMCQNCSSVRVQNQVPIYICCGPLQI